MESAKHRQPVRSGLLRTIRPQPGSRASTSRDPGSKSASYSERENASYRRIVQDEMERVKESVDKGVFDKMHTEIWLG